MMPPSMPSMEQPDEFMQMASVLMARRQAADEERELAVNPGQR